MGGNCEIKKEGAGGATTPAFGKPGEVSGFLPKNTRALY